jgi:hypothetical protein
LRCECPGVVLLHHRKIIFGKLIPDFEVGVLDQETEVGYELATALGVSYLDLLRPTKNQKRG